MISLIDSPTKGKIKIDNTEITNLNNEELSYNQSNFEQGGIIIATNNALKHKEICLEIKEIIKRFEIYPL